MTAADFNGDGRIDIAAPSYSGTTVVTYLRNAANSGFTLEGTPTRRAPRRATSWPPTSTRDGRPDLAITNLDGGSVTVLLRNAANSGFASEAAAIPVGASPEGIEAADFNGDGCPDIAVAVLGTNTVNVLLRKPGGGFTAEAPIPVGAGALGLATADFNADGRPDLAVTSNTAGTVTRAAAPGRRRLRGRRRAAGGARRQRRRGRRLQRRRQAGPRGVQRPGQHAQRVPQHDRRPRPPPRRPPAPPAPPVPGKSVVVRVVSGTVLIKYPPAGRPAGPPRASSRSRARPTSRWARSSTPTQGPRRADVGGRHRAARRRRRRTSTTGIFQVKQSGPEEEAQEAGGADHRPGDEGPDRALAVRAAEGRAVGGGRQEEEGPEGRARASCGATARASSAPTASTAPRRCAARSGSSGSLRGHAHEGPPRRRSRCATSSARRP